MQDFIRRDLTDLAKQNRLSPVLARQATIRTLLSLVNENPDSSIVITGEPGVGKTSVVEGLASTLVQCPGPTSWRVLELDCNALVAGTVYRGQFEERCRSLLQELAHSPDTLIFIDEIHTLIGLGGVADSPNPFANLLKRYLSSGQLRIIGATTNAEYDRFQRADPALARRFVRVPIPEPNREEAIAIVHEAAARKGGQAGIVVQAGCAEVMIDLSERVHPQRRLPERALDILTSCLAEKSAEKRSPDHKTVAQDFELMLSTAERQVGHIRGQRWKDCIESVESWIASRQSSSAVFLTASDIRRMVSSRFGIIDGQDLNWIRRLSELEQSLRSTIVGQAAGIDSVCESLRRAVALGQTRRPIGSFLFVGPTGVGKTELARALSEFLWGAGHLIQLNMSEYMDREAVNRLIGAPPGYTGYDEGGRLVRQVAEQPLSVVLFDEIEKAHPDVLNLLLQILEDGELQDSTGKICRFSNSIVILTSNAAGGVFSHPQSATASEPDHTVIHDLREYFRPEILNRLDRIVVFSSLSKSDLEHLLHNMLQQENERLRKRHGVEICLKESARDALVALGFDPAFGARPLRRALTDRVMTLVADALLSGRLVAGEARRAVFIVDYVAGRFRVDAQ